MAAAVVLAPLWSGGWRLEILPVLFALVALSWGVVVQERWRSRRSLSVPLMSIVLGGLALLTAVQAVPLGSLLAWVSPRAAEVRSFVAPDERMTVTYEVGATWRESSKLLVYALVAAVAHEVARRRSARRVLVPVVVAGLASVAAAFLHRVLRLDAMWGFLEGERSASQLVSTFQNPNHASAFLTLCALTAVGLGLDPGHRRERYVFLAAGVLLAGLSVVEPSKGGVLALVFGLVLLAALLWLRSSEGQEAIGFGVLLVALVLPLAGIVLRLDDVVREFGWGENARPLGLVEKLAAAEAAWPIVIDHPVSGIGRGAYISVAPQYQATSLQLTFAFPENVVLQFLSEWGLIVGGFALLAVVGGVFNRVLRVRKPHEIGASVAVASVLAHDMVDFSLEMPGVAIAAAAIMGSLSPGPHRRSRERRRWTFIPSVLEVKAGAPLALAWAVAPLALASLFLYGAFRAGDLQTDLAWLRTHSRQVAAGAGVDGARVQRVVRHHPANVLIATQVAYIREVQSPRDLPGALAAINRALYLGPRYADAHVLAGRLLLRAGHRQQAFGELRRAWQLTGGRQDIVHTAEEWARSAEEIMWAVPRSDPALDIPDPVAVAGMVRLLAQNRPLARGLLKGLPPIESLPDEALGAVADAAAKVGALELALDAARQAVERRPEDAPARLLLARLAHRAGQHEEAKAIADRLTPGEVGAKDLLDLRLGLALAVDDYERARGVLDELRLVLPATRENQNDIALRKARLHMAEGRPDRVISELGPVIAGSPTEPRFRFIRAEALAGVGRKAEARIDLEVVLRREPGHRAARKLLERLSISD